VKRDADRLITKYKNLPISIEHPPAGHRGTMRIHPAVAAKAALGLEHLAQVVARLPKCTGDTLIIPIQPETRKALEKLATIQSQKSSSHTTPAEVAAAILEEVIAAGKF
jgi:hypothetical protein